MKSIKVNTNCFEVYDKFSKLDFLEKIQFEDNSMNRKRISTIFNNINNNGKFIDAFIENGLINIIKKKDFELKIYFKNK